MKRTLFALLCFIGIAVLLTCQKEEAKPEPEEKPTVDFISVQTDGVYDIKSLNSASALFVADDNTQSATYSEKSKTAFRLIQPYEGKMVSAQFSTKSFSVGSSYDASITVFGNCGVESGNCSLKCLQKDDNRVWFQDAANNAGYIFSTGQL